VIQLVKLA